MFVHGDPFSAFGDLGGPFDAETAADKNQINFETDPHAPPGSKASTDPGTPGSVAGAVNANNPRKLASSSFASVVQAQIEYYHPPTQCMVAEEAYITFPASKFEDVPNFDPQDQSQIPIALSKATTLQKQKLAGFLAAWKAKYPWAPDAALFMWHRKLQPAEQVVISVNRPATEWDPVLLNPPPIEKGDPREKIFASALRIFFPDLVFETESQSGNVDFNPGHYLGYGYGSYTALGPFPLGVKYVSDRMVDFAVDFMKGGGFGNPAIAKDMASAGAALSSASKGIAVGASVGGPYGAVAGALVSVGDFLINLFGQDAPKNPPWLKKLLHMRDLRESGLKGPSFWAVRYPQGNVHGPVSCHRAIINPTEDGVYTLMDGYAEFLKRLATGGKSKSWWKWALLAAGGAAAAMGS